MAMKLHTLRCRRRRRGAEETRARVARPSGRRPAEGYLKYLVESRAVYEAMEAIVASGASPIYAAFVDTGLERTEALSADIAWFTWASAGSSRAPADGPGAEYAAFLRDLAESSPPEFICHFWASAHRSRRAGASGRKVSEMILDGKELAFYKWGGRGLETSLADVKEKLNQAAEGWSREEKDACLEETSKSFQLSGKLLRLIA